MATRNLGFEDRPAVGRITVSSAAVIRPLAKLHEDKPLKTAFCFETQMEKCSLFRPAGALS